MKISQEKQVVTVTINETDSIHYYERLYTGSKILARSNGTLFGNSFRYQGIQIKKYGRGKLKNADAFHAEIEKAELLLRSNGYQFVTKL